MTETLMVDSTSGISNDCQNKVEEVATNKEVINKSENLVDTDNKELQDNTNKDKPPIISNNEILDIWAENNFKIQGHSSFEFVQFIEDRFKQAKISEREAQYAMGEAVYMMQEANYAAISTCSSKKANCFSGISSKELMILKTYYSYINFIRKQGRDIKDVYLIEPKLIYEMANLEIENKVEEVEQFVLNNNVGTKTLKRMIEIINKNDENTAVSANIAHRQVIEENKKKQENIQEKRLERIVKSRPYLELKVKLSLLREEMVKNNNYYKHIDNEHKKLLADNLRTIAENLILKKQVNKYESFKEYLKAKSINFDEFENSYKQSLETDESSQNSVEQFTQVA